MEGRDEGGHIGADPEDKAGQVSAEQESQGTITQWTQWMTKPLPIGKPFYAGVTVCPRCKGEHGPILFKPFSFAPKEATHWSMCPVMDEPLLLWISVQDTNSMNDKPVDM